MKIWPIAPLSPGQDRERPSEAVSTSATPLPSLPTADVRESGARPATEDSRSQPRRRPGAPSPPPRRPALPEPSAATPASRLQAPATLLRASASARSVVASPASSDATEEARSQPRSRPGAPTPPARPAATCQCPAAVQASSHSAPALRLRQIPSLVASPARASSPAASAAAPANAGQQSSTAQQAAGYASAVAAVRPSPVPWPGLLDALLPACLVSSCEFG
ncbi:predicted GPI-anchored protein 58 [Miscanthus floridulus]|uniref:predicted GPI-anchored protein 58 n=1 Tax=Miscanthus floridulus TaxID=154761 RepID=UPI003459B842